MASKVNLKSLLDIAWRRMEGARHAHYRKLQEEANALELKHRAACEAANLAIRAEIEGDIKKLQAKINKIVIATVSANSSLVESVTSVTVPYNLVRVARGSNEFHNEHEEFQRKLHRDYETLELTLALADTPAALKAEFEKFLESLK